MTAPLSPARRPSSHGGTAGATCPGLFPSSDGALPPHPTVEPGRLPSDAPGVIITVVGLGPRSLTADEASDMGLRHGETIGPRTWDVLVAYRRAAA